MRSTIRIQSEDFNLAEEVAALRAARTDIGAIVTFTGLCRDEGGALATLELEHYPGMAEKEIARVVAEADRRWSLQAVTVIHRHGKMTPGDPIVLVATAAHHRRDAFAAADFVMDFLKTRAPFWKRETATDGGSQSWVAAKAEDEEAVGRWTSGQLGEPGAT